ncbi:MAG: portal protein [Rhodobacteraceae bacterium]|nr:portal protein [Paracoccaceae bacterium]
MAEKNTGLFSRLTSLFRDGPSIKRRVKSFDNKAPATASSLQQFRQAHSSVYSNTMSAYGSFDRMSRYSDFAEMEATPEISSALDIYAEETVSADDKGNVLHIYSENRKIRELLQTLFYDTLNADFNLPMWVRNLVKYGDFFLFNDVSPEFGVIACYPIPISEIEREEGFDPNDPGAVRFRWMTQGNQILENWQVSHFRLLGNDAFLPYGSSVLESARRIWRQLILIEDAMLVYRIIRAPERRVFYIDVGNVPPEDVATYLEQAKNSLKREPVINKADGRVDLRYNPMPVWKDTPIPLLDGRTVTIEELSKEVSEGAEPWVYSIQDDTHQVVPGKVTWCGRNYTAEKMIKVWLDDDTFVMTAPEHPFVMRDGTSKRADELLEDDSLMPLYRKVSSSGYESVYNPAAQVYEKTHQLIAKDIDPVKWDVTIQRTVHHKEPWNNPTNKLNNNPSNLEIMSFWEHRKWHADHIATTANAPHRLEERRIQRIAYNKSDEKRALTSKQNIERNSVAAMSWYNGSELHKSHNESRKNAQLKSWAENKEKRSIAMKVILPQECVDIAIEILRQDPSLNRDRLFEVVSNLTEFRDAWEIANAHNNRKFTRYGSRSFASQVKNFGYSGFTDFKTQATAGYQNHRVTRTEEIFEPADVYCMTVVGSNNEDDRHNFAVLGISKDGHYNTSGIFVQNSVDEDYFLPVRGGDSGTKIDTLAGGQNTAAIEDVEYIQKKLFAALKVPKAYLGYDEDIGSKATLAQEDIRFSRAIARIQRTVISELNKLAMVHLYSHGFTGDTLIDFELKLSNPSSIAQQQKLELISTRFDIAGKAPEGLVDRRWIQKNVMHLTDEEIDYIASGRVQDKELDADIEASGAEEEASDSASGDIGGGDDDAGGLFASDQTLGSLLIGDNNIDDIDDDDDENISINDEDAPIKIDRQIKNAFGEPIRKRKNRLGPGYLEMPDLANITGIGSTTRSRDTSNKPFEGFTNDFADLLSDDIGFKSSSRPRMSADVTKTLLNLDDVISNKVRVLSEDNKLAEALNINDEEDQNGTP